MGRHFGDEITSTRKHVRTFPEYETRLPIAVRVLLPVLEMVSGVTFSE